MRTFYTNTLVARVFIMLAAFLFLSEGAKAQTSNTNQITVNDGTTTCTYLPVYGFNADVIQRSEFIIPATLLESIDGSTIDAMTFYANYNLTTGSFKVYLREVDETTFSGTDYYTENGATTVYTGTLTISKTDGMTVSITDGYEYKGGNLLIGFYKEAEGGNYSSSSDAFYGVTAEGASLSSQGTATPRQRKFLPKVTFAYTPGGYRKPASLTIGELTNHTATLTWSAPTGDDTPTGYAWQYKEASSEQWAAGSTTTETTVTLSQLTATTAYDFRVKANYDGGESSYATITFTTEATSLSTPRDLTCELKGGDGTKAELSWTETGSATAWQICLNDDETNLIEATTNPFTVTGLTPGTTYTAKVRAKGSDEFSRWSDAVSFTLTTSIALPFACDFENTTGSELPAGWTTDGPGTWQVGTGDDATSTGAGQGSKNALINHKTNGNVTKLITPAMDLSSGNATLSFMHIQRLWNPDQDELRVYYRTSPTGEWTQLLEFTGNISSWTTEEDIALPNPSGTYQIAFEMTDHYGHGVGIDKVEIAKTSIPKPTGLTYTLTPGNGTVATLSWTEKGSATAWQICLNDDETNLIEATTNSYNLTGLTPETTYTAKVRSVGTDDNSPWSDPVSFTPTNRYQLTVNDGTDTNTNMPVKGYRGKDTQRSEFIIPAASLTAIPTGRIINAMKFYANYDFTSTGSFQVYLREVDKTAFSSTDFYTVSGATTVYTGTLTVSATDGMTISMDDGYEYEGGNLLVGFYKEAADGNKSSSQDDAFYGVAASGASISKISGNTTTKEYFQPKVTISFLPEEHRKPRNLTIDVLTSNSASLTWTAPTGENAPTGYVWQYKESGSDQWVAENSTTETTATLTQLKGNTTYDFRLKAVYEDGERSVYVTTSFTTDCGQYPIPYTCDFENIDDKRCWTMVNCTENHSVWLFYTSNSYAKSGNYCFMFSSLDPTDGPQYLISPELSGTDNGVHVEFYYRSLMDGISYEQHFQVGYSKTDNQPASFTWDDPVSCTSSDYLRFSASYPTGTKYVAVKYIDTESYYLFIDDIKFEQTAPCKEPINVEATKSTTAPTTSVTVNWTPGSDETKWDIYVSDNVANVPVSETTPTVANVATEPYTLTSLNPGTTYYIYVRAVNGNNRSYWSTPAMVDTKAEPMALPYSYGFEEKRLPCSWNVITSIPTHLTSFIDNEKEDYAHSGNSYLVFRRRPKANTLESDGTLITVLPEVSEAYPLNGCQLRFWAKKTESETAPKFTVGIMTNPDDPTTFVQQGATITPTSTYKEYTVRFNEYTGTGHFIAIKQTYYGESCIDDIVVEGLPACWPIEDLAAADISGRAANLSWTGYSDAYDISYRTAEINNGFSESFGTSTPDGWERKQGKLSDVMDGTNVLGSVVNTLSNWMFGTKNNVFDDHARINIYGDATNHWLITPTVTLTDGTELDFDLALTGYSSANPQTTGTDDRFVVLITTDDKETWTIVREWNNSGSQYVYNNISTTGQQVSIDLSSYAGANARIAFYGESTIDNADNNLHIDNVAVVNEQEASEWQTVSADKASAKLTGLSPLTKYEVKVRGNCGSSVSEWSDPITFTTVDACMGADLAVSDVGISTATVSWTGTSDSYDVKYRTSAIVEGLSESFDKDEDPQRWLQYTTAVDKVLAGTAGLGHGGWGSWEISSNTLGAYNMALNILDYNINWLTTPEIILGSSPQMSFDVALTANNSEASANIGEATADDRFVVLVYADNEWTKLREWNNSGSQYVFDNIANAGEHVTIDISAYASKTVKIAFYGESTGGYTAGYTGNDLHIDNVFVGQQQAAGEWQTATTTETTAELTGLTPATKYDVKVVSACGDESEMATFTTKDCADIVFAKEGYATYYNGQRDMVVPDGMTAYIVTDSPSEGKLSYYTIAGGTSNTNIVTAGTAVLLQVEPTDEAHTITVQLNAELSGESSAENMLQGSDTETTTTGKSGDLFYKLTYNTQGTTIGWYWGADDGAPFVSGAHKAWLALPAGTSTTRSFIDLPGFNEASSVTSIQRSADNGNDDWYTIGGLKLQSRPTKKGIYLNNGRKVVVK